MIAFYDIDEDYINFLKQYDPQVPNIKYSTNNKFVCGIVLTVNEIHYYAPISHTTQKYQTSIIITNGKQALSSIRFSFMFPAPEEVLHIKDFAAVAQNDPQYANLLQAEYEFCLNNESAINSKAQSVYAIGCNKNHKFNKVCCDFKLLEQHYEEFTR